MSKISAFNVQLTKGLLGSEASQAKSSDQALTLEKSAKQDFATYLKDSIDEVNQMQKTADKMAADVASGKNENIHETMLALSHAEVGFKLMVQVRNKALEAYQEIMRMPV